MEERTLIRIGFGCFGIALCLIAFLFVLYGTGIYAIVKHLFAG